jgi:hypothetical protein
MVNAVPQIDRWMHCDRLMYVQGATVRPAAGQLLSLASAPTGAI